MRITNEHVGRLLEARLERIHRATENRPGVSSDGSRADLVSFSARAEDVRIALLAARAGNQAEESRLAALASQVRAGTYRVSADTIVDALLRDL